MKQPEGGPEDPSAGATVAQRRGRSSGRPESGVRSAAPGSEGGARGTGRPSAPVSRASAAGSQGSALDEIMRAEEATRAHGFAGSVFPASLAVALALPMLGGDPLAKKLCIAGLSLMAVASLVVFYLTRDTSNVTRYSRAMHHAYGWLMFAGVLTIEYYVGFFSPVVVILALGTHYYGQSTNRTDSFAMPLIVIGSYALLSGLIAIGVIEDRGVFPSQDADLSSRIFSVLAATGVLLVSLRNARVSRAALREAIERSVEALMRAQRREAQLAEAHHQLDNAMRVAVGKPGRYTNALAGAYRLDVVIGIGAMGEVYGAVHETTEARAAVKLLLAAASARDDMVERILREGAISQRLASPHIVQVFETGRMSDGAPYLVMELLQGRDLATRLRQDGQLQLPELSELAEHLGAGLQHAHEAGVIHRDLKPLNIFGCEQGGGVTWKILDFGISKLTTSSGTLTQEGVVGTPGYMSPEQARGVELSVRSDVFSMAVVLYRAMTGQPAFPGEGTPQIMFDIVYKGPKRPGAVAHGLNSDIDLVMAIALAKDPDHRFQSAAEFAAAFVLACRRRLPAALRERGGLMVRAYPWDRALVTEAQAVAPK